MKIVVVGGYGTFGGRFIDLVRQTPGIEIQVAGRDVDKAIQFCAARGKPENLQPLQIDRRAAAAVLAQLKPFLVVDASGPFQTYDGDPYDLVRAVIAANANYIDLADGASFVNGIGTLDEAARAAKVFVLSGLSSCPALTAAVVRKLAVGLSEVHSVVAGIAPSPKAIVGPNVIRAIASYAGKPVDVLSGGRREQRSGFFDSKRMTVRVPGQIPLAPTRFALAEVPDLRILPAEWPGLQTMWMGAGPTPAFMHRLLWLPAGLVRLGLVPSLLFLVPLMNWAVNTIRWGEHRGGMVVEIEGSDTSGTLHRRSWHLLAEGDSGPYIPSMAAEAVVRKCLRGDVPSAGARAGHRDLELADYDPLLARWGIKTGVRDETTDIGPPQRQVMGNALDRLAPPLRLFHDAVGDFRMKGRAFVECGTSVVAGLVARIFGFPRSPEEVPVTVDVVQMGPVQTWTRDFGGQRFSSRQKRGSGRYEGLLVEGFGPINFGLALVERESRQELINRRWDILGLPMPRFLMSNGAAFETGADGRFNFDVDIRLPLIGRIVRYRGWLARAT